MRFLFFTLLLIAMPALADEYKADLTKPLVDLRGSPWLDPGPSADDPKCEKCLPLTIGATAGACIAKEQGKGPAYWALAQKLMAKEPVSLSTAEIHAVRECVDKMAPLISGQVDPVIDPNYQPDPIK